MSDSPKWTLEQSKAIYEKDNNILVAAAAGSGKTAVLVERIIQKILTEKFDIDKLLVVTFTNAAASEMRERILSAIYKKLDEEPNNTHLERQILLLGKANICTIHSFCLDVIRNYFYEIDLPANFKIASQEEVEILKQETLEDVLDDLYASEDEGFLRLVENYATYSDDEKIRNLILDIYKFIQSMSFPNEWLNEKIEIFNKPLENQDFSQNIYGKILLDSLKEKTYDVLCNFRTIQKNLLKYPELENTISSIDNDLEKIKAFYQSIESGWDTAYIAKGEGKKFSLDRWKADKDGSDYKEEVKTKRDKLKERLQKQIEEILKYPSSIAYENIYAMYSTLKAIYDVIIKFEDEYTKRKRDKNIIDFNDIEHYALHILVKKNEQDEFVPTDVALSYRDKFKEIAIDEYQDSNQVQEYILSTISNGKNMFMVGDVKQSIYRFRQACPELFMEKYDTYYKITGASAAENVDESANGKTIQLFKNFRSRKNILDFTNIIFENIMSKDLGEIDYTEEEYLNLGLLDYPEDTNSYSNENLNKTEILLIELKENEEEQEEVGIEDSDDFSEEQEDITQIFEKEELEAKVLAKKIKEIIDSKVQVYDKNTKALRDVTYKDIVVLLRKTALVSNIFEKELYKENIPVYSDANSEYLETYEIQTILNTLKIIDNPLDDISLVSVLRSEIGAFTDNELVKIRLKNRDQNYYYSLIEAQNSDDESLRLKVQRFVDLYNDWKTKSKYLSLAELVWDIFTATGFYEYVSMMPNGKIRKANLKKLFEHAKSYETTSFKGLFSFIQYIEKVKTGNSDISPAKLIGENENVVRIMSIHKSKGLEFPIVFLANANKNFNANDLRKEILLHQKYGLGPQYINHDLHITCSTSAKDALKIVNKKESLSEEMRILYVALTRAREKLYIIATANNIEKVLKEKVEQLDVYNSKASKLNPILLQKSKSFLDWVLLVYQTKRLEELASIDIVEKDSISQNTIEEEPVRTFDFDKDFDEEAVYNKLHFEYKNKISTILPLKSTVSKIKQIDENEDSVYDLLDGQFRLELDSNEQAKEEFFIANRLDFENNKPQFMQTEDVKVSSARKGTITHLILKKLDFTKDYTLEDLQNIVNMLVQKNVITTQEASLVKLNQILNFLNSNIAKALKTAKTIYQEKPFVIKLSAHKIFENANEDLKDKSILVQGIIDLAYEDAGGDWYLVDYKTDYVENGNMDLIKQRYAKQLLIYKQALEEALNIKIKNAYIYSLSLNQTIEIA